MKGTDAMPAFDFKLRLPLAPAAPAAAAATIDLVVTMPPTYPATASLSATCLSVDTSLSRSQMDHLNAQLREHLDDDEFADVECVMEAVGWATEAAEGAITALAEGKAKAAEAAASAAAGALPSGEWRRCFYWIDHMLEGKQHKKEAKVVDCANSLRLTGQLYYGRPGIIVVEGPLAAADQFEREARKAGKTIKIKKSQALPEKAASRRYQKFTTVSEKPGKRGGGGGLDKEALQAEVDALGLTHKYKHIIGVEELQ